MDLQGVIISFLGGLGMFIYGMTIMSESLKRIAGERMKAILAAVSTNRVLAALTGFGVTAVIQSSTAVTVTLVGFVNAGLMSTAQAVGVALGAHIGTTLTAQILAFKISQIALPCIALGVGLRVFANNRKVQDFGGFLLGFGFLFFGLTTIQNGVGPIRESSAMVEFFTRFEASDLRGIILCVMVGAVATMIIQSSTVTVGLTMILASQGLLTLPGAMALVLGDNIGTTLTAELAAINTDLAARRMARTNSVSNLIGATYMVICFPLYYASVVWVTQTFFGLGPPEMLVDGAKPNIARYVANAHTIFNVINTTVMLTGLPLLLKAGAALTRKGKEETRNQLSTPIHLDQGSLVNPAVALSQTRKEIVHMAEISLGMAREVFSGFISRQRNDMGPYDMKEEALDSLQKDIHKYLINLYGRHNTRGEQQTISTQMALVNSIERLGDTTINIAQLISSAIDGNICLSDDAMDDYKEISATALEFYELVISALKENRTDFLPRAKELEQQLDEMRFKMRDGHMERLRRGVCNVDQGLVFTDMLNYFERTGDYLLKISRAWVEQAATGL
jgi:phosphate:Na+ symporter